MQTEFIGRQVLKIIDLALSGLVVTFSDRWILCMLGTSRTRIAELAGLTVTGCLGPDTIELVPRKQRRTWIQRNWNRRELISDRKRNHFSPNSFICRGSHGFARGSHVISGSHRFATVFTPLGVLTTLLGVLTSLGVLTTLLRFSRR